MRNISFSLTTPQVRAREKDVTRRIGWWFLKPGDILQPIEKGQGLKKGEHVVKVGGPIRVVSTRREQLCKMKRSDLPREGFPQIRFKHDFVQMFCRHNGCEPTTEVNRIEFEYL
jgi:hypothetical protein